MKLNEISRVHFSVAWLLTEYPAKWQNKNKQLVVEHMGPVKKPNSRHVTVSRWQDAELKNDIPKRTTRYTEIPGFFKYRAAKPGDIQWHLNFANEEVFVAYGGGLLAQDELQCLEHPVLGSVREALVGAANFKPLTVENGKPTPILITGVDRRCKLHTTDLYGNRFKRASPETIKESIHIIDPPTVSNIIAMEAPHSRGLYTREQIRYILTTAVTVFAAAVRESGNKRAVINTGFWGCGAYGGNQELMALLQLLAARIAGVPELIFRSGSEYGYYSYKRADELSAEFDDKSNLSEIVDIIFARKYVWGMSNGT